MSLPCPDCLSPELRDIERQIDDAYRANPLTNLAFAAAGWSLLAFGEDLFLAADIKDVVNTIHKSSVLADTFVNALHYPLHWCYSTCRSGGEPSFHNDSHTYRSASELIDLGKNYTDFCTVFTYASRGMIDLRVEGSRLIPTHNFLDRSQYEAYNRLIRPSPQRDEPFSETTELVSLIRQSLRIRDARFSYKLNRSIAKNAHQIIGPGITRQFRLPDSWQFSRYSLGDFRRVFESVTAMAFAHLCARYLAASEGCPALGHADSLFVPSREELLTRVGNYSGVETTIVLEILHDLTYGTCQRRPDPALQPLIPLNAKIYAIMPNLWINSSAERNLTALLNRLPGEKTIYARLVAEKESFMKEKFDKSASQLNIRVAGGPVSGDSSLPDIDFAMIDDVRKTCLLFELKWFIEPAEVREVIEKTQELQKGVKQLVALKRAFESKHRSLMTKLGIDASYTLYFVLASENWIGHSDSQHPEVPIIKASHILDKLMALQDLAKAGEWINSRAYLPAIGIHYDIVETKSSINGWTVNWYGIKPLLTEQFSPN